MSLCGFWINWNWGKPTLWSNIKVTCMAKDSTAGKNCSVAFIWMVTLKDSSTDSKVRTTLYSIINTTTGKYCSVAFIWMVTLRIHPQTQMLKPPHKLTHSHTLLTIDIHEVRFPPQIEGASLGGWRFRGAAAILLEHDRQCLRKAPLRVQNSTLCKGFRNPENFCLCNPESYSKKCAF